MLQNAGSGWHWSGLLAIICLLSLVSISGVLAQVTGVVYRDFNENGTREYAPLLPLSGEIGVGGVTVTLYSATGAVVGTALTSSLAATQGQYSIVPTALGPYRVQFSNLPAGYFAGVKGAQSGTTVQFINTTAVTVVATANLGINYPSDYCQANPNYLVPCYVNGNSTGTGTAASEGVLIALPYSSTGDTPTEVAIALNNQTGSVFGLAYQRAVGQLYSGAFVKRHTGLGSGGAGAIYLTRQTGSTFTTTLFTTLNAGTVATNADRGLPANINTQNTDASVYGQIGKAGLGNLELSEDGTQLYVVNLADRRLYQIPINNATSNTPTPGTPLSYSLPTPAQRAGSVFRPFALKVYRGKVYVGGVTTNEGTSTNTVNFGSGSTTGNLITRDTTNMKAFVYEFDPADNSFDQVLSFPLTYRKGATNNDKTGVDRADRWLPWTDVLPATGQFPNRFARNDLPNCSYPQPWLTGIEFDVDGTMIVSLRDRSGDQFGNSNYGPVAGSTTPYRIIAPGDILRAGKCNPAVNQWTIENNARVCGGLPTVGANNGQGFNNGEYYHADAVAPGETVNNVFRSFHLEMAQGGLVVLPGSGDVSAIVLDPTNQIDAGGIRRFRNADGSGSPATSVQVYQSGSNVATYGKANGLGSLALTCGVAPIEIGNRIWNDGPATTVNGIQDNGLSNLANVTVQLYRNGTLLATTTSDANGEYYFNNTNVPGGLLPFTAYELRVPLSQTALSGPGYVPVQTGASNDGGIDNDAISINGNAVISVTTGSYGQNDHTLDFGFATCPTITNPSAAATVCSGTPVPSLTVATTATGTGAIRFVYFTTPQSGTAMYAGGTLLSTATPASGTAGISNAVFPANTTTSPVLYYVYAILNPTPNADGCRPAQQIVVTVRPNPVATATGGIITCVAAASVTGSSSVAGSTFAWTGPGSFVSSAASFTTSTPGVYTLTVTASGCSSLPVTATVVQNTTPPQGLTLTASSPLSCTATTVRLTASSSTTGLSYAFSGPGVVSTTAAIATVNQAGTYTVRATGTNGCTATATATVSQTLASATLVQGVCNDNNTNANTADDYYTILVRATAGASGPANRYEVVLGGTVLNPGGTLYGQSVTVGSASAPPFRANGSSIYTLIIRDSNVNTCQITPTTLPVASCSSCDFVLCPKVNLTRRSL